MIGSSIVSIKLASAALTREMVHSETARRLVPNVLDSSKRWLLSKLQQHGYQRLQTDETNTSTTDTARERLLQQQQEAASAEYLVHHWLEALFAWFQVIVLWHEPRVSLCAISGLLSSFLLLTYFAPRFYATIMIALFLYNLNKFWFRHIWPEIRVPPGRDREEEQRLDVDRFTYLHPQLMTLDELREHFREATRSCETHLAQMLQMRQHRPVAFASLLCALLSSTAYLGNRVSGMSLIFCILTALMTAPGIYVHLLSEHTKCRLLNSIIGLKSHIISITSNVDSNRDTEDEGDDDDDEDDEDQSADLTTTTLQEDQTLPPPATPHQNRAQETTSDSRVPEKDLIDLDDDFVML